MLFDDKGELWDAKSRELADVLDASSSSEDLRKYVVRNLGFIAVMENSGSLRLQLRPAVVSQMALSGLLYWMHDRPSSACCSPASTASGRTSWWPRARRPCAGCWRAPSSNPVEREGDFLNKPRPLNDLAPASPLRAMLNAWSECSGKYDRERLHRLLNKALMADSCWWRPMAQSPGLLVKEIGPGLNNHAGVWLSRIRGLRVEDQPDYAYGKWVASLYREVLQQPDPSLHDVDAVIRWPHQPRVSYRYQRLVVPFEAESALNPGAERDGDRPRHRPARQTQLASVRGRRQAARRPSRQSSSARCRSVELKSLQVPLPVRIAEAVDHAAVDGPPP